MARAIFFGLFAVCALAFAAAVSATSPKPTVRLINRDPVVVRVAHFKPREAVVVRVVVRGVGRLSKAARAGVRGGLNLRFPSLTLGECSAFSVTAVGSRGSRATFTMHPPPCGPAP